MSLVLCPFKHRFGSDLLLLVVLYCKHNYFCNITLHNAKETIDNMLTSGQTDFYFHFNFANQYALLWTPNAYRNMLMHIFIPCLFYQCIFTNFRCVIMLLSALSVALQGCIIIAICFTIHMYYTVRMQPLLYVYVNSFHLLHVKEFIFFTIAPYKSAEWNHTICICETLMPQLQQIPNDLDLDQLSIRDIILFIDVNQCTQFEDYGKYSQVISCTSLRKTEIPTNMCKAMCLSFLKGVVVVKWLSSWFVEKGVWGSNPGLATRFQRLDISCFQVTIWLEDC